MSGFSTVRLHYVAADGSALLLRESIDNMDKDTFELYLKYHFATCEREDLAGVTSHALDIFKKQIQGVNLWSVSILNIEKTYEMLMAKDNG